MNQDNQQLIASKQHSGTIGLLNLSADNGKRDTIESEISTATHTETPQSMITTEPQLNMLCDTIEHEPAIPQLEHAVPSINVCFTGVSGELHTRLTSVCDQYNILYSQSITSHTTHLICNVIGTTDNMKLITNRTSKYCEAILHGIYIVSYQWLIDSIQCNQLIDDYTTYEIISDKTSGIHLPTYTPYNSRMLSNPQQRQLCHGMKFQLLPQYDPTDPPLNDIIKLIELSGGSIVPLHPSIATLYNIHTIHDDATDYTACILLTWADRRSMNPHKQLIYNRTIQYELRTCTIIWLLNSICKLQLLPVEHYRSHPIINPPIPTNH